MKLPSPFNSSQSINIRAGLNTQTPKSTLCNSFVRLQAPCDASSHARTSKSCSVTSRNHFSYIYSLASTDSKAPDRAVSDQNCKLPTSDTIHTECSRTLPDELPVSIRKVASMVGKRHALGLTSVGLEIRMLLEIDCSSDRASGSM